MKRKAKPTGLKKSWEQRIEITLGLGQFVSWNQASDFAADLDSLLDELASFASKKPKRHCPFSIFSSRAALKKETKSTTREAISEASWRNWPEFGVAVAPTPGSIRTSTSENSRIGSSRTVSDSSLTWKVRSFLPSLGNTGKHWKRAC